MPQITDQKHFMVKKVNNFFQIDRLFVLVTLIKNHFIKIKMQHFQSRSKNGKFI